MTIAGKPLAGICVSTVLFACGVTGFPDAPSALPLSTGPLVLTGEPTGAIEVAKGEPIKIVGDGFADYANVTMAVYSTPIELAEIISDDDGAIAVTVTLPSDLVGVHTLTALGNAPSGDAVSLQTKVSIIAPAPVNGTLPQTGLSVAGILLGGLGLVIAGFALVRTSLYGRRFLPSSIPSRP